jgi:hypothetical protein
MGNFNSGRRRRGADRCEALKRIEMSYLRAHNMLTPGKSSSLSWSRRGEPSGRINVEAQKDGLRLIYRTRQVGEEWRDVDETIPYAYTRTAFDGRRAWFVCPSCRRRCSVLYGFSRFRCRKCHRLTYASQYEAEWERSRTKSERIRRKLGDATFPVLGDYNPFPPRPRGMWRSTYERLRQRDAELLTTATDQFAGKVGALLDRLGRRR